MKNCRVSWTNGALDDLAEIWLRAVDREAVNHSVSEIELRLQESPTEWGRDLSEGLRSFTQKSLRVLFYVVESSKMVRIVAATVMDSTNGRSDV